MVNGNGKKVVGLITALVVLIGMIVTGVWQLDSRVEVKVEKGDNMVRQEAQHSLEKFSRTQDVRYYHIMISNLKDKISELKHKIEKNPMSQYLLNQLKRAQDKLERFEKRIDNLPE